MLTRRGLITGLISLAAAPAIVRIESLMPVKVIKPYLTIDEYVERVMQPYLEQYTNAVAEAIIHGKSTYIYHIDGSIAFEVCSPIRTSDYLDGLGKLLK